MTTLKLTRFAMACEFEIVLSGTDPASLEDAASWALDEVESLDQQLSAYNPASEVSYVNAHAAREPVQVDPGLFAVLALGKQVAADTDGALDITAGPLIALWRNAESSGIRPGEDAIRAARDKAGIRHLVLDETRNTVRFERDDLQINLGAIGKGFAVQRAAQILRDCGVEHALVHGGKSTICAFGSSPGGDGWNVGIRHPDRFDKRAATLTLRHESMSTSGGVAQRDERTTEQFEHIIDPSTGIPVENDLASVTVVTADAAAADALSTAFYVRGEDFAADYCRTHPDVGAMFIKYGGDATKLETTTAGTRMDLSSRPGGEL